MLGYTSLKSSTSADGTHQVWGAVPTNTRMGFWIKDDANAVVEVTGRGRVSPSGATAPNASWNVVVTKLPAGRSQCLVTNLWPNCPAGWTNAFTGVPGTSGTAACQGASGLTQPAEVVFEVSCT